MHLCQIAQTQKTNWGWEPLMNMSTPRQTNVSTSTVSSPGIAQAESEWQKSIMKTPNAESRLDLGQDFDKAILTHDYAST